MVTIILLLLKEGCNIMYNIEFISSGAPYPRSIELRNNDSMTENTVPLPFYYFDPYIRIPDRVPTVCVPAFGCGYSAICKERATESSTGEHKVA